MAGINAPSMEKAAMRRRSQQTVNLTSRQVEVIRLWTLGCSTVEIAAILGLTSNTVQTYKSRAKAQLGTDRAALVTRLAFKHKYTSLDDKLSPDEERLCGRTDNLPGRSTNGASRNGVDGLSAMHSQVIRLTSLGCSVFDVAAILGISSSVAMNQKLKARHHLGAINSALVTRLAIQCGISSMEDRLSTAEVRKAGFREPHFYANKVKSPNPLHRQIIRLTSLGCARPDIADILSISLATYDAALNTLREQLGSAKATHLTRYAIMSGISPLGDELTPAEQRKRAHV